jgi:hypothetical protein
MGGSPEGIAGMARRLRYLKSALPFAMPVLGIALGKEAAMIEFFVNHGLWFVLAGVFLAMHWFGMGCCGGRHRHGTVTPSEGIPDGPPRIKSATDDLQG